MNDYAFKTTPYDHQRDLFHQTRDKEYFAFLWEMGAGKTKEVIDTTGWLYGSGKIEALLVIAPNGVHKAWILDEIPTHLPEHYDRQAAYWTASPKKQEQYALDSIWKMYDFPKLRILSMNTEALSTEKGYQYAKSFLIAFDALVVVDESTTIKDHSSERTKNILKLKNHAKYRRILTGTPVTNNPLDVYTQFEFLDESILRCGSYYAFRTRYAVIQEVELREIDPRTKRRRKFKDVVGYQRMDELQTLIAPYSHRITKDQCLDLPEKIYQKRYVELSKNQKYLYDQLRKEIIAELDGQRITAQLAITKIIRLQQIVGGFWCPEEVQEEMTFEQLMDPDFKLPITKSESREIDEKNQRINALLELIEAAAGKVIIWARFRPELEAISKAIRKKFGPKSCVEYHGGVGNDLRREAIERFQGVQTIVDTQAGVNEKIPIPVQDQASYFVGNPQSAGMGLTLTAATTVIYYSNSFNYADRAQSEDRCHRIGQTKNVNYIDMIAPDTIDEKIISSLRTKQDYARIITGDDVKKWI